MMQFSFGKHKAVVVLTTTISFVVVIAFFFACNESTPPIIPPDHPPQISSFVIDSTCFNVGYIATLDFDAIDDNGIDSAVIDFGDGSRKFKIVRPGQKHYSPVLYWQYGTPGFWNTSLTVYDTKHQTDSRVIPVMIYPDSIPCSQAKFSTSSRKE